MNLKFKVLSVAVIASGMMLPTATAQQSAIRGSNTTIDHETGAAVVTNAEIISPSGMITSAPQAIYVVDTEKAPRLIDFPRGATFSPTDRSSLRVPSGTYYPELQTVTAPQVSLQRSSGSTVGPLAYVDITCRNGIIHENTVSTGLGSACYGSSLISCGGNRVFIQFSSRTCSIK